MGYRAPLASDLSFEAGRRAYMGMSHSPERRAESDIKAYVELVHAFWMTLNGMADTADKLAFVETKAEEFRVGMVKWQGIVWSAYSRCMSPMITGPARFPVDRNRKAMDSYDRRCQEWHAWQEKFAHRAQRDIQQIGVPQAPSTPSETIEVNGVQIVKNFDLDRVQIVFPGKPDAETIGKLKGSAWNWSPRNKAWQRKLTDAAIRSAQHIAA